MTTHGGNRKRAINRTMRRSNAGKFRRVLEEKAKALGITIIYVDAKNTSQECAKCGHISKENRPTRDKFHCTNCKHESQADANACDSKAGYGTVVFKRHTGGATRQTRGPGGGAGRPETPEARAWQQTNTTQSPMACAVQENRSCT